MQCPNCKADLQQVGKFWICPEHGQVEAVLSERKSPTNSEKLKVFISYGRNDARELADRHSVDLAANGYRVWQDVHKIRTGSVWHREIEDGLRSSQIVVALLSPHAVRRQQDDPSGQTVGDSVCLDEISYAQFELSKPVVPALAHWPAPFKGDYRWSAYSAAERKTKEVDKTHATHRSTTGFAPTSSRRWSMTKAGYHPQKPSVEAIR